MVVAVAFHSTADAVCARRWHLMRIGRWWLPAVPLLLRRRQRMAVVPPPSPSASARPAPRGLAPRRRCVLEQRCLASRGRGTQHQRNLPHASDRRVWFTAKLDSWIMGFQYRHPHRRDRIIT